MRLLNRPLALILALALAGASIILIVEVIAFAVHASPVVVHWATWYHWAGKTRWNCPGGPGLVGHPDRRRRAHPRV